MALIRETGRDRRFSQAQSLFDQTAGETKSSVTDVSAWSEARCPFEVADDLKPSDLRPRPEIKRVT